MFSDVPMGWKFVADGYGLPKTEMASAHWGDLRSGVIFIQVNRAAQVHLPAPHAPDCVADDRIGFPSIKWRTSVPYVV